MSVRPYLRWFAGVAILGVALWFANPGRSQAEKHLTVYAPSAVYGVNVVSFDGLPYVGLSDLLEPLGNVEAKEDGKKWKLHFTRPGAKDVNAEFQDGKNRGKVHGDDFQLSGNFHMENGRGYVPLHNVGAMLPLFVGLNTDFRESSLRLLLGKVAVSFSENVQKGASPKLTLNFSAPVNPMVSTEPGKVRLVFRRDALVNSGPDVSSTGDPTITGTNFNDTSGTAQITINGSVPLTVAFADGNRSIVITPVAGSAPAEVAKANLPPTTSAQAPGTLGAPAATPAPPQPPAPPRFLVIIDPAHGGDERGAAITDKLAEKDVNLAIARRLQHELQNKGINAALLRTGDTTMAVDDRAMAVNAAHAAIYICVHSANLGTGLRIFTALMSPTVATKHTFLPWPQAQAPYLDTSSQIAGSVSAELSNRQIPVTALPAPLRPMRNIATPAIAIEVAPPGDDVNDINSGEYQENIAAAVANGIAVLRPKVQAAR